MLFECLHGDTEVEKTTEQKAYYGEKKGKPATKHKKDKNKKEEEEPKEEPEAKVHEHSASVR